jgi:hypothetical protein
MPRLTFRGSCGCFIDAIVNEEGATGVAEIAACSLHSGDERDRLIAERDRLREALQKLIDFDFECHCEHNNANCCELNNVFCPRCTSAVALRGKQSS